VNTRGDLGALVAAAAGALAAAVEASDALGARFRVPLEDGRSQTVRVALEEDTLRFATRCGEAVLARNNPSLHRTLLAKNATLRHGFFALAADGALELQHTQLLGTCDLEEFTTALANLAAVGDFLEQELARGAPGESLDLY
jgi:hypothetical protein